MEGLECSGGGQVFLREAGCILEKRLHCGQRCVDEVLDGQARGVLSQAGSQQRALQGMVCVCVCGGGILPLQPLTPEENCANLKRIHQLNNKIK